MLYSSREFPPIEEQAATLAALGYTNVETFPDLYEDLARTKVAFDRHGLKVDSMHSDLHTMERDLDETVRVAQTLGASIVVAPWLEPEDRPVDAAGWQALGERLGALARQLKEKGLLLAWHNHDFEFVALADGSMPIEHLLDKPDVWLELDAAWVYRAGADPVFWVEKLSDRILIGHVKDVAPKGIHLDEDGWTDVGQGEVPWETLWPLYMASPARLMIVEHDQPSDYRRFAERSATEVRSLARGETA